MTCLPSGSSVAASFSDCERVMTLSGDSFFSRFQIFW